MASIAIVSVDNKDFPDAFLAVAQRRANGQGFASRKREGLAKLADNSVDTLISFSETPGGHAQEVLFELVRVIKSGGSIIATEPLANRTLQHSEQLSASLTLAGFSDIKVTPNDSFIEFVATKPNWNFGATQTISIKKKAPVDASVWATTSNSDLIDEKDLLGAEDFSKPGMQTRVWPVVTQPKSYTQNQVQSDCEITSTKKACKNCSCGRAEQEPAGAAAPKPKLTAEMIENPGANSSCGNVRKSPRI